MITCQHVKLLSCSRITWWTSGSDFWSKLEVKIVFHGFTLLPRVVDTWKKQQTNWFLMENSIVDVLIFKKYGNIELQNTHSDSDKMSKLDVFFEKTIRPLKNLRIFCWSFEYWMAPNGENRFFWRWPKTEYNVIWSKVIWHDEKFVPVN